MIVKMKKVYLLAQKKDAATAIDALAEVGTVHVDHLKPPAGKEVNSLKGEIDLLEKAVGILPKAKVQRKSLSKEQWQTTAQNIIDLQEQAQGLTEETAKRHIQINAYEPWGDFNPQDIVDLEEEQDIFVQLCMVPQKNGPSVPAGVVLHEIKKTKGQTLCAAISREDIKLPFETVALPSVSLSELQEQQQKDKEELLRIEKEIKALSCFRQDLEKILQERTSALRFQEALTGMQEEGAITYLKGFCPVHQCAELEQKAKVHGWGLFIEDPAPGDKVPTLLRNPKLVGLSKPALDMVEILPGYKEVDVSPIFIIFFTLFFGILIGDAGYGVIFAVLTLFAQWKLQGKIKEQTPFHLMYLLTGFTIVWGVLTGTYFGQQWLPEMVNPILPWLNDFKNIQWLCFTIALVHLSIARVWKMTLKFPDLTMLAEAGWLLIIWGMYFLANMFVLNQPIPEFALWFFGVGISLAFVFMVPFKDFLKEVPQQIIPFLLSIVGAGTDIISYIRLYAVGLATVAVADAANSMPQALPEFGVGYFFLVFLHGLNMVLAAMAILVHAVRLNVLEFSGHLSLEWLGFKYNPLSKMKVNRLTS